MPKSAPRRTGGQINVTGILYQMLVTLKEGLDATVTALAAANDSGTIEIQPEPFDGGDVQLASARRVVIQIKGRAAHRRWSVGDIIRDVLPDLVKAVRVGTGDQFQFVTDNDAGCDDFRRFLAWYARRASGEHGVPEERFRYGAGTRVSGEELLAAISRVLKIEAQDPRLQVLLSSLQIVRRDEVDCLREIDVPLGVLVERIEDVPHKRMQLVGELVRLGAKGTKVTTAELLRGAGLDPRRLVHAGGLARSLAANLREAFPMFRYAPESDVRRPLAAPTRSVTVLRGESGMGKTWRLCATALAMADAGRPVIMLRASADVDRLRERIATAVWNPIYGEAAPLRSIAARLQPAIGDERGVWLTVFLDDLNDQELARSVIEDDWRRLGIDIVVSSQPATADFLARSTAAPEIIEVPEFTPPELFAYLAEHQVDQSGIADDVIEVLRKPVMARLYCQLPHGLIVRAETEYELMQSFWDHASDERPTQIRHALDLVNLELLVGDMLSEPPAYPWPPTAFARALGLEAVEWLILRGLVELDGRRRLSMTHDRLLNWAMARHLADRAVDRNLSPQTLQDLLVRAQNMVTVSGVRIGGRLGYVLMDLLWLLLEPGRWSVRQVADLLLAHMRDPEFDAYDRQFFSQTLPTLGPRGVPLLRAMVGQQFDGDRERHWPGWLADGMRRAADTAWEEVREAAMGMFSTGEGVQRESALSVLAKVDAPELLDELNELNLRRTRARKEAAPGDQVGRMQEKQRAFNALARAARSSPHWLNNQIACTADAVEAEQLLWVLVQQRRSVALPIWLAHRDHLFATIPGGARVLPNAVRVFADPADLPRLRLPPPEGAEMLFGAVTFDAVARLDAVRAIAILRDHTEDDGLDLRATENWWMPGLYFRTRTRLGEALRQRSLTGSRSDAADALARLYAGHPELMEDETVDVILDGLEAALTEDGPDEERLRRSYRLLKTLSSARTAATLATIAARAGTRLERVLADIAIARPPSSSRVVDHEGEMIARLLALMAGTGYDKLVLAQLGSSGTTTREYGLSHALWTSSSKVAAALETMAQDRGGGDEDRPYHLMQALAAHGGDGGIVALIRQSSPVYTHAVEIRQAQRGDSAALAASIRTLVATDDPAARLEAVDLSHFLTAELALDVTAPLIAAAEPGGDLAARLLMLHQQQEHYEPALLPKLMPFLESADAYGSVAALHLALNGDSEGRTASVRWLADHGLSDNQWRSAQAAFALLDHDDSLAGAIAFLQRLHEQSHHFGRLNADILDALARHGDPKAREQLVGLAHGSGSRDLDAVAGAVRLVMRDGTTGAYQAARRLFAKSGQQEAARLLIEADPVAGLTELVTAYVGAPIDRRLAIARTLRWRAPLDRLLPALAGMANAADETTRAMAAEIGGWIPHAERLPWLESLASDPVRQVENAALDALHRRASGSAAAELIAVIPALARPAQWAAMCALIDHIDPHLLAHAGDPLDIRTMLASLPDQFGIEAQRLLNRRRTDVDKKAAREGEQEVRG